MVDKQDAAPAPAYARATGDGTTPGINWEPGEEDYPFAAVPGETAVEYFSRWLEQAPYARVEQGGVRYLNEADVTNVVNHITADVGLLRARLGPFGDRVVTAEDYGETIDRIERAVTVLGEALDSLRDPGRG